MKKTTLESIKKTVYEADPELKETDSAFMTAVIMLAAFEVGQNVNKLTAFTGFPRQFIRDRVAALRVNKIWKNGITAADWADKESGGCAFWLDVAVAEGLLQRR